MPIPRVCLFYFISITTVLMAVSLAIAASVKSILKIDPPGPVAVLNPTILKEIVNGMSMMGDQSVFITCRSTGNYNITWDVPDFNFAEISNHYNCGNLLKCGRQENDLPRRVNITTNRNKNGDGFTSTLTMWNMTGIDEGYYTCRTTNQDEIISSRVYVFINIRHSSHFSKRIFTGTYQINSLRSAYILPLPSLNPIRKSSIVIPCWALIRYDYNIKLTLQRRNPVSGKWEQITNLNWSGKIHEWVVSSSLGKAYNEDEWWFQGVELFFDETDAGSFGEYRCHGNHTGAPFSILVEGNNTSHSNSKPIIRPPVKYLVLQSGSTFDLVCETSISSGNVTWQLPDSRIPSTVKTSKSRTMWSGSRTNKRIVVATLTVSNATFADTGFYTCLNEQNASLFSEQFVFIQDLSRLLTFTFDPSYQVELSLARFSNSSFHIEKDVVIFKATFSSPVTIGIIPTLPNVDVRLYHQRVGESLKTLVYPPMSMNGSGSTWSTWSYDKFKGFSMNHSKWDIAGTYEVVGSFESSSNTKNYSLQFMIYVEGIEIVSLDSHALLGREMSLQCRSMLPFNYILLNRRVVLHCSDYPIDWFWTPQGNQLEYNKGGIIEKLNAFPIIETLRFSNLTMNASGTFRCKVPFYSSYNTTIEVLVPKAPVIVQSIPTDGVNFGADAGHDEILSCQVDAFPPADILWIYNKESTIKGVEIISNETWTNLKFRVPLNLSSDGEDFTCQFTNSEGSASKTLKVHLKSGFSAGIQAAIVIPILIVVIVSSCLLRNIYLTKKREKLIRLTREKLLFSGDSERINPDIPLEEQVDHLPYDPKWEFPPERLILGKQLGAGKFGIVLQAQQNGTIHDLEENKVRQVAIKMIKPTSNPTALESLLSELKIMIHLGPHINVVNLLGACTKEIEDGILVVIEEFCQYGNVRDYLIKNRACFINELNEIISVSESQTLENVTETHHQEQNNHYLDMSHQPDQSKMNRSMLNEQTVAGASSSFKEQELTTENKPPVYPGQSVVKYETSNQAALLENEGYLHPISTENPELDSKQRNPRETVTIRTQDLICWSFQIASGMNHLANKKVIHGDLAARNVLLAAGNVIKVADFGLSRQTQYKDGTYLKKGKEPLPVKWMAIESLTDRKFTTQSDVWSFGVVLWELFSLGKMPYAEIPTSFKQMIRFLQNNGRLEKPSFMPIPVSDLTMNCWKNDPKERPDFSQLKTELGNMLKDDVHNYFLNTMDHP